MAVGVIQDTTGAPIGPVEGHRLIEDRTIDIHRDVDLVTDALWPEVIPDVQIHPIRIVTATAATRGRVPHPDPEGHTVEQGPGSIAIDVPEVDMERVVSDVVQVAVIHPMRVAEVVCRPIPRTTGDRRVRRGSEVVLEDHRLIQQVAI